MKIVHSPTFVFAGTTLPLSVAVYKVPQSKLEDSFLLSRSSSTANVHPESKLIVLLPMVELSRESKRQRGINLLL